MVIIQRTGKHSIYKEFECFDVRTYFGLFLSICLISGLISCYKRSLKSFFTTFWSYLSVILSDYYTMKVNTTIERLISGVWLLTCTVLLAAFSGQLREQIMKSIPIHKIEKLGDLSQPEWNHLYLQSYTISTFKKYLDQLEDRNESEKLSKRTEMFDIFELTSREKEFDDVLDYERVANGTVAIVWDYQYLQVFKQNLISRGLEEEIDFHISSSGEIPEPFFTVSNKARFSDPLLSIWDMV